MKVREIEEMRMAGKTMEAYELIRPIYASTKTYETIVCMFNVACDVFRKNVEENNYNDAEKILMALDRLVHTHGKEIKFMGNTLKTLHNDFNKTIKKLRKDENNAQHIFTGEWGEIVAEEHLRAKGYAIIERDWHSGHKDIDIIAKQGAEYVFIEVKTRTSNDFIAPEQAVNTQKLRNLRIAINHYIKSHDIDNKVRFDIITIVGKPGDTPSVNHITNVMLI